ncbi:ABC transporter substrate-binding protein [Candidatus Dojkabacteria bacterium]|uniref:ABC transporter substrate-binding protein n=1 Tax=Candidatus Dojkabacteria bacterium TaxID=2099670 RepID=A0A955RIV0_9BACT|nr:ABC transporter substrate-binding protein [Candidatus Dojkabacteria bacterium]
MNDPYDSTPTVDLRKDIETLETHAKIRKSTLLIIFVLSALLFLFVFYQNRPQPGSVTVGTVEGQYSGLIWVAKARGDFEYNSVYVDIKTCKTTDQCINWVNSGTIDIAVVDDYALTTRISRSKDLRAFASVGQFESTEIIYDFKKGYGSLPEIENLEVGLTSDSLSEYWFYQAVMDLGYDISDYEIVETDPYDISHSMSIGEIIAGVTWNPLAYDVKNELSHKITSENLQHGEKNYWLLVSNKEYLDTNHELAGRFLNALLNAENYIKTNPTESKQIMADSSHLDYEYMDDIWRKSNFELILSNEIVNQINYQLSWRNANKLSEDNIQLRSSEIVYTSVIENVKPHGLLGVSTSAELEEL